MLYPITFSVPESKMIKMEDVDVNKKKKILSSLIPGKIETYIYHTEEDYYNEYKKSLFATTTKKGGWDCLRHYEILANGCIPYFPDIEYCNKNTLALFPKELIIEGNKFYEKIKDKRVEELSIEEYDYCDSITRKLLQYTYENLTCKRMAEYVLKKTNKENVKKILFLSGNTDPDYLRCLTLIGFKELLGENCHDYPKINHIYKTTTVDYEKLYGKGYTYSNILNNNLHSNELDINVIEDIKNKKYDIVVYGSYTRGIPYYSLVKQYYFNDEIILLCGEDSACSYEEWINNGHFVFMREF